MKKMELDQEYKIKKHIVLTLKPKIYNLDLGSLRAIEMATFVGINSLSMSWRNQILRMLNKLKNWNSNSQN